MDLMPRISRYKMIGVIRVRQSEECIHPSVRIADFLPPESKPELKGTMIYRVTDSDFRGHTGSTADILP
jgi:hypothetical protein